MFAVTSLPESASQAPGFLAGVISAGLAGLATLGTVPLSPECGGTASSSSDTPLPPGVSTVPRPPQQSAFHHSALKLERLGAFLENGRL